MATMLELAITAIRSGRKEEGRQLLNLLIQQNPNNEMAWLWMSSVVAQDEQRARCLYHVLAINPDNEIARKGLQLLGIVVSDSRPVKVPRDSQPIKIVRPTAPPQTNQLPIPSHPIPQPVAVEERRPFRLDPQAVVAELPFTPVRQPFAESANSDSRPVQSDNGHSNGAAPQPSQLVQPVAQTPEVSPNHSPAPVPSVAYVEPIPTSAAPSELPQTTVAARQDVETPTPPPVPSSDAPSQPVSPITPPAVQPAPVQPVSTPTPATNPMETTTNQSEAQPVTEPPTPTATDSRPVSSLQQTMVAAHPQVAVNPVQPLPQQPLNNESQTPIVSNGTPPSEPIPVVVTATPIQPQLNGNGSHPSEPVPVVTTATPGNAQNGVVNSHLPATGLMEPNGAHPPTTTQPATQVMQTPPAAQPMGQPVSSPHIAISPHIDTRPSQPLVVQQMPPAILVPPAVVQPQQAIHTNATLGMPVQPVMPNSVVQPQQALHNSATMGMPVQPAAQNNGIIYPSGAMTVMSQADLDRARMVTEQLAVTQANAGVPELQVQPGQIGVVEYRTAASNEARLRDDAKLTQALAEEEEEEGVNVIAVIIFGSLTITALGGLGMLILLMVTTGF